MIINYKIGEYLFMLKVISFYLPQFHSIPENDAVWGKGFTEWNSVQSAKPLFKNHNQPRVPLDNNYYNLLNEKTLLWQTKLAESHNIYGFCIYHYWFSGKLLLNKPLEILKNSKKIHFPYCICWANESWTNAWTATGKPKSFLKQEYGDMNEWKEHFNYLLNFFKDPDYIVENNKPMLVIYRPENIPNLNKKLDYWNKLAIENGFDGLCFAYQQLEFREMSNKDDSRFTYSIEYQPKYALSDLERQNENKKTKSFRKIRHSMRKQIEETNSHFAEIMLNKWDNWKAQRKGPKIYEYSRIADRVIERKALDEKSVAGMFVGYDDTPRKGKKGTVIQSTSNSFSKYLFKQVENVKRNYSNEYLFMFAWNEWGESGYLEPDTKYKCEYLDAIKRAVEYFDEK